MRHVVALLSLALALAACEPAHVAAYTPKRRVYEPTSGAASVDAGTPGSLFRTGGPGASLFTDARAFRIEDLVVVRIEENADAERRAETETSRESESEANISAFLGQLAKINKVDPDFAAELAGRSSSAFSGKGSTGRTERFTATVPAVVRQVLPNGNLFIEGHRVVLVNDEEQHFYISGVVRPIDIDEANSVKSSMVADAEIEFTGRGVLTAAQQQGILSRYLGWIWPF